MDLNIAKTGSAGIGKTSAAPSLSEEQSTLVRQYIGLKRTDLEKMQARFERAGLEAPAALVKLGDSFERFDKNGDKTLSVSEISKFAYRQKDLLYKKSLNLIGAGEGTELAQLELMKKTAKLQGFKTDQIETVIDSFERIDKDKSGKISSAEFYNYAKAKELAQLSAEDSDTLEEGLLNKVVENYSSQGDSSLGFLVGLFA